MLYVLASIDHDSGEWLSQMGNVTAKSLRDSTAWSPAWVACRSLAIARTTTDDPEPLRWFIRQYIHSDILEAANLNYWAYWVGGEDGNHEALSDRFMADELGSWHGRALLRHLISALDPGSTHVELSVHSLWALLDQRPHLLEPGIAAQLGERSARLLDDTDSSTLASPARREIDQLHYAARMATPKGAR